MDFPSQQLLDAGFGPETAFVPVKLTGKLSASRGWLVSTSDGMLVVRPGGADIVVTKLAYRDCQIEFGALRDTVRLAESTAKTSAAHREDLLRVLWNARYGAVKPLPTHLLMDELLDWESIGISRELERDEAVVAVVRLTTKRNISSSLGEAEAVRPLLVVTCRREFLMVVHRLGDIVLRHAMTGLESLDEVFLWNRETIAAHRSQGRLKRAAELSKCREVDRIFTAFTLHRTARASTQKSTPGTIFFLNEMKRRADARYLLSKYFCSVHDRDDGLLERGIHALLTEDATGTTLAATIRRLGLSFDEATLVFDSVCREKQFGAVESVVDLLWSGFPRKPRGDIDGLALAVKYGRALLDAGRRTAARRLILDCTPTGHGSDASAQFQLQLERDPALCEVFCALEEETFETGSMPLYASRLRRWNSDPFAQEATERLFEAAPPEVRSRVQEVLKMLDGSTERDDAKDETVAFSLGEPQPLSADDKERVAGQHGHHNAIVKAVEEFIGEVPAPDVAALRDYCSKATPENYPTLVRAAGHAEVIFGLSKVDVYVSSGRLAVGIQGYQVSPMLIVCGERHLVSENRFALSENELRFLVGVEFGHLWFEDTRLSNSHLWKGAAQKGGMGIDVALTLLPMLRGAKFLKHFRSAVALGKKAAKKIRPEGPETERALGLHAQSILEARLYMRLRADRAGLLLANDIASATRALYCVDEKMLDAIDSRGFSSAISFADDELAKERRARAAALMRFYISDEYDRLLNKCWSALA